MLSREIYLIVNGSGSRLGEFLVELHFDQPGILATLSNIFAEHDVNIINIAIDSQRRHLHFVVDLTTVVEDDIREIAKRLGMFAFVKKVRYRVSNVSVFVPRWIVHVINGMPSISLERELVAYLQEPSRLAEELAKKDAKTIKELVTPIDIATLEEILYLSQLRGLAIVENTMLKEGRLVARLCKLAYPMAKRYLEYYLRELGFQPKTVEEGGCIRAEV
ncbi:MAG: ACT domain-containing protein [Pyrobaculum sp.]